MITLTDALGCERCQEIFVLHEDGYLLEGLKTAYPYPKKWYWTGTQWTIKSPPQQWFQVFPVMRLITIALLFALLVVFISLILPIVLPLSYGWWIFVLGMVIGFSIIFLNRFQG
ncbi:MAG: hypothetical protein VKJ64_03705 [Leptolyngbyaceae bacterium]|nr:hypothetical protein [Leptolyngbyaceae bacterium]